MRGGKGMGLLAIVIACALGVAACGGSAPATVEPAQVVTSSGPTSSAAEPPSEATEEAHGAGGFSGQDATNYEDAKTVCEAFSRAKVAKEVGLSPDADSTEIAEAYSHGYRGTFQQAVFKGCLAGLR